MSNLYRGPPIDASYQVSIHLAKRFQTEEKIFQKSSNQKQELSMVAIFFNGQGRNEQSQQRTFHRCFLPSFGSFGLTISKEKNLIFSIVFYVLLIFSLIFKFEKQQQPCLMAVGVIIHGLIVNYICIVPLYIFCSLVATLLLTIFKEF